MKKTENLWLVPIFAAVLCVCLFSEALLRRAAVARINPDQIMLNQILADLPVSIQTQIQNRIARTEMRTRLEKAETPHEKASAMIAFAMVLDEKDPERLSLLENVLHDYPDEPSACPAYLFFLFHPDPALSKAVSVGQFHIYQKKLPPVDRFNAWAGAYSKFKDQKAKPSPAETVVFLSPLLEIQDPPFFEFSLLFRELSKAAASSHQTELAKKADELARKTDFKRSCADYCLQIEEEGRYRNELAKRRAGN